MTLNEAKNDGCYGAPAVFVQWDAVQVGTVSGSVANVITAEALVATQSHCTWGEWVGAILVGFQTTQECLVPGRNLCHIQYTTHWCVSVLW